MKHAHDSARRTQATTIHVATLGLATFIAPSPCAAEHDPAHDDDAAAPATQATRYPLTFELAALTTLAPKLYELPLEAHGGRATVGARIHSSAYFSYAPQLAVEYYRGHTPHDLTFSSTNVALLLDVTVAVPWLHWELLVGVGSNSLERATQHEAMTKGHDVVGISVSPEWELSERAHLFALLGHRWFEEVETTVVGVGFRM